MAKRRRRDYRRKKSEHALRVNFRLRKVGGKPIKQEATEVFEHMLDTHRVPKGWKVAVIEWNHTKNATSGWHTGDISDLAQFDNAMEYMLENGLKIGIDRAKSRGDVWEIEIALEY